MKAINRLLAKYPNFRETFLASITGIILVLGQTLGIEPMAQLIIGLISGSHFVGQGIANLSPVVREQTPERKLASKKLRFSLLFMAMTALGSKYGFSELTQVAIGIISTLFNVGIGITDSRTGILTKNEELLTNSASKPPVTIIRSTKPDYDVGL